jgi:tetratricopeptide (TPR) repeat protein
LLGVNLLRQGRFSEAIEHYRGSGRSFEAAGELENLGGVHALMAEAAQELGEYDQAWDERAASFDALRRFPRSRRLQVLLRDAVAAADTAGLENASHVFQDECVAVGRLTGDALYLADALTVRARSRLLRGRIAEALEDIAEARRVKDRLQDPQMRARLVADLDVASGLALQDSDAERADRSLALAQQFYERARVSLPLVDLFTARARIAKSRGRLGSARRFLGRGIEILESRRDHVVDITSRLAFLRAVHGVYGEAISLEVERVDGAEEALYLAESARAVLFGDAADKAFSSRNSRSKSVKRQSSSPRSEIGSTSG